MLRAACLLGMGLVAAAGCSGRSLYHYHRTVVGVDISGNVSESTPSGRLTLGYSRRLVAAMPDAIERAMEEASKSQSATTAATTSPAGGSQAQPPVKPLVVNLPPTVFCTQVKASLGGVNSFREILATGTPAEGYAQQLAEGAALVSPKDRNFVCPGLVISTPERAGTERKSSTAIETAETKKPIGPEPQAVPVPEGGK
jgi:hypothetical protein